MNVDHMTIGKDAYAISSRIAKLGYKTYLIINKFNLNKNYYKNVKIIEINVSGSGRIRAIKWGIKAYKALRKIKPDIVMYLNPYLGSIISALLYKIINRNIFLYMKMDYNGERPRHPLKAFLTAIRFYITFFIFDLVSIETNCARTKLKEWLKLPTFLFNKLIVIENGYNEEVFDINSINNNRQKIILTVARINKMKGIDLLLRAVNKLFNKYKDWKLIIIGPIEDHKYFTILNKYISINNLNVEFVGYLNQENLSKYYKKASIFVLPSRSESFGIVRFEAAANGLPVVTTDTPCKEDLEKFGFVVVPVDDLEELYNALEKLIADKNTRVRIVQLQLSRISNWTDIAVKIINNIIIRFKNKTCN